MPEASQEFKERLRRAFEEIEVGATFEFRRTFTEGDLAVFCGVTGDYNPYHLDDRFAAESWFGRRTLPGLTRQPGRRRRGSRALRRLPLRHPARALNPGPGEPEMPGLAFRRGEEEDRAVWSILRTPVFRQRRWTMRMLLKVQMPVEKANTALKDGSLQKTMESVLNDLKPEAAYFLAEGGKRTALIVFDMRDPSQIPVVAEPFFQALDADLVLTPVMNAEDLQKGLQKAFG